MKNKFPGQALALSLLLFSGMHSKAANLTLRDAFVVGIIVVFCAVLAAVMRSKEDSGNKTAAAVVCGLVFAGLAYAAYRFAALTLDTIMYIKFAAVAVAVGVFAYTLEVGSDTDEVLRQSAVAYGMLLLTAAVRELASYGSVFGYVLTEGMLVSSAYAKIACGFIFAGIYAGLAGLALKVQSDTCGIFVVGPAVVVHLIGSAAGSDGIISACLLAVLATLAFVSVKNRNIFAAAGSAMRGMPLNLLGLGIAYMVLNNVAGLL